MSQSSKNPAAVALGRRRWSGMTAQQIAREVPRNGGRPSKPTPCPRCGHVLPSAAEARKHKC